MNSVRSFLSKRYLLGVMVAAIFCLGLAVFFVRSLAPQKVISSPLAIHVAASFYPLYFFAHQIGGAKASVVNITPSGAEPHDYEPTPRDIAQIEASDILIVNGGGLEAWGNNIRDNLKDRSTIIVTAADRLTTQDVIEKGEKITDPHVWLSPSLALKIVDVINKGFIQVDSLNGSYYQANADVLKGKLMELDQEYRSGLVNCKDRNIVTSHAAFGYLATTYGLNQVAITGISPDAEPSPQQMADIADFAKAHHTRYIFFEDLVSPKLSQAIASEVGAQTLVLNPLEGLSNEQVLHGKDYFSEMRANLTNLKIALSCPTQ